MEREAFTVSLTKNPAIEMKVIPGHFTTSHLHMNHYLDLDLLKTNAAMTREVAKELAVPYLTGKTIDTIVCMERTEIIGAYLAEELMQKGLNSVNSEKAIHVVTPISNVNRNLMFNNNMQKLIYNRNIILLVSSVSSGITLNSALECLSYYGGVLTGISALFNANPKKQKHEINSIFTNEDVPDYQLYYPTECPMCNSGQKLDAIIVHDGYIKI